jgi:hypothetical protein
MNVHDHILHGERSIDTDCENDTFIVRERAAQFKLE